MAQQTQVQVLQVEARNVNTKKGPGVIYDLKASDGRTYSTFDAALGQNALQLQGQVVTIDFDVRQNGNYTNYTLNGLFPQGAIVPVNTNPPVSPSPAPAQNGSREDSIVAQSAYKAACELAAGVFQGAGPDLVPEVVGFVRMLTDELAVRAKTGSWSNTITTNPIAEPEPVAAGSQQGEIEW